MNKIKMLKNFLLVGREVYAIVSKIGDKVRPYRREGIVFVIVFDF